MHVLPYTSLDQSQYFKVNDALRQEKLQYLQAKVVYEELNDILLNYEISRLGHEADNPSAQVKNLEIVEDIICKTFSK